ncbi:hypothetical protein B0H13DRAFT_2091897 [Mycena leptocephala]|nr:hypothetical protein B0H13DRAFT_2091897 [Mycena leptocephala]
MAPTPTTRSADRLAPLGAVMAAKISHVKTSNWMRSIRRTDSLHLLITNLSSLAIIATFLAAVQAQVIGFSLDKNDTHLQKACNALFFAGLFIDILSGTIAIVGAVQLQRTYGLLQQRDVSLKGLIDIAKKYLTLTNPSLFPRMWNAISESLNESADLVERTMEESKVEDALKHFLLDYRYTTDQLAASGFRTSLGFAADLTVSTLVLAGLGCLIGGAFCFVLYNQPVEIWATSLAVLGSTILLIALVVAFIMGLRPGR